MLDTQGKTIWPLCLTAVSDTGALAESKDRYKFQKMRRHFLGITPFVFYTLIFQRAKCQIQYSAIGNPAVTYMGDGTFYGQQSGQNDLGECSFGEAKANTLGLPWSTGVFSFIAMNDEQWEYAGACGLCIMYRGLGDSPRCKSSIPGEERCGTTPITSDWKMGLVDNRCSECRYGDIDQDLKGDGRWLVEWYSVPCNVGETPFQYTVVDQNEYYLRFVISNTRVPISSVDIYDNSTGTYVPIRRLSDNTWGIYNGPFEYPLKLRISSVLGDVVEDSLEDGGNTGKVQFPPYDLPTARAEQAQAPTAAGLLENPQAYAEAGKEAPGINDASYDGLLMAMEY
eukprot:jgi/Botrbrau1/10683/Bobra.139_2s0013.1